MRRPGRKSRHEGRLARPRPCARLRNRRPPTTRPLTLSPSSYDAAVDQLGLAISLGGDQRFNRNWTSASASSGGSSGISSPGLPSSPCFDSAGRCGRRRSAILPLGAAWVARRPRCACTGFVGPWRVDFGGVEDPTGRSCDQIPLEEREIRLERPHFDFIPSCLPRGFWVTTVMSALGGKAEVDFGRLNVCL